MTDIRRADHWDSDRIVALVKSFNDDFYHVPLNMEKTRAAVLSYIKNGIVLVSEAGFIAGALTDDPFRDQTFLIETGWYALDRSGIRLLDAFIKEGRSHRVDEVRICHMNTSSPRIAGLLKRKGFELADASYSLIL